jgi:hypothetical protein
MLDGEGVRRLVLFDDAEGSESVLEGFTLTRGSAGGLDGGAILAVDASPTIRRCRFVENGNATHGGAISALRGAPLMEDCEFLGNVSTTTSGAVRLAFGGARLVGCLFEGNRSGGSGGALGMSGAGGSFSVSRCVFRANEVNSFGGAIGVSEAQVAVINGLFDGNVAGSAGGAVSAADGSNVLIAGSAVYGNVSALAGGAMYAEGKTTALGAVQITAHGNRSKLFDSAGGFLSAVGAEVQILNSIVRDHGVDPIDVSVNPTIVIRNSNIDGGWASTGIGNIDVDPRFVRAGAGDFRLLPDSPCAEAGNDNFVPPELAEDLAGHPRITDLPCLPGANRVDMGAYELPPTDCDGSGLNDVCEILSGAGDDCNRNGILDDCEQSRFPGILVNNRTGIEDAVWLGGPNDVFAGLGGMNVVYDLGGGRVVDRPGADLNVYELDFGAPEFDLLDVLVSLDGVWFESLKPGESALTRVSGDSLHGNDLFGRSYDLAVSALRAARYIKLEGRGVGEAGAQNGFDLDAVGVVEFGAGSCPGDIDGDGDVDVSDMVALPACLAGPGVEPAPNAPLTPEECLAGFDVDHDGDVDLDDVQVIFRFFSDPPA